MTSNRPDPPWLRLALLTAEPGDAASTGRGVPARDQLLARATDAIGVPSASGALWVPGRLELLGKHTDYAGGRSLLCAADRGVSIAFVARGDDRVVVRDAEGGSAAEGRIASRTSFAGVPWATYASAVVRRFAKNFPGARRGAEIAFASDLPPAAGMSSSSALVVGIFLALARANGIERHPAWRANVATREDLAAYLATVENGSSFGTLDGDSGVGTFGGSEDHTAIIACRAGVVSQYSFCPTRLERVVPMPAGAVFAVASSGVAAEKTGGARRLYNRSAAGVSRILDLAGRALGARFASLAEACSAFPRAADAIARAIDASDDPEFPAEMLRARFEQFVDESEGIVPEATEAVARGDLVELGRLVDRSQALAEAKLRNQVPETTWLARAGRRLGAHAASAFGAGFGGSVWALVEREEAVTFLDRWRRGYASEFPGPAARSCFFLTGAGPGAFFAPGDRGAG